MLKLNLILTVPRAGKGENEQYLVRNAFLNWDKDASGKLDYEEFRARQRPCVVSGPISRSFGRRQRHVATEFGDVRRGSHTNSRSV